MATLEDKLSQFEVSEVVLNDQDIQWGFAQRSPMQ
jgi:hypothetical protein